MHRDQTVSEMVEQVLAHQAKSLAERTGQAFESALGVVGDTEAGQRLRELANGEYRHEKATGSGRRACTGSAPSDSSITSLGPLGGMSSRALGVNAITRGLRGTWSGLKVRKHAHPATRFWKRSSPACKGDQPRQDPKKWGPFALARSPPR